MNHKHLARMLVFFLSAGPALIGVAASAANAADTTPGTAAANTLEEIVVTAQKRKESVQDVPISVTVLSSDELMRQGTQTINDLARMSASLEFTTGSPGGGAFIRGIGTENLQGETAVSSVGIVLDGVVLGNTPVLDIFDIDHVEILKGPQGTLFGSSVSAGVINITTNAPDPTKMSSTLNVEYGSPDLGSEYSRRALQATANLPLTDTSALRFSFHSDDSDGVFHNNYTGFSSQEPDIGMRVRYLWDVNDDLKINLIADYNKDLRLGVPLINYRSVTPDSLLANALAECGITAGPHNFDICSQYTERRPTIDAGFSAQVDWTIGANTLTSISAIRKDDQGTFSDIVGIPIAYVQQQNFPSPFLGISGIPTDQEQQNQNQYSEELRLASPQNHHLEWLVGLYFQHWWEYHNVPGQIVLAGSPPPTIVTDYYAYAHTSDEAAFANFTYYLADATRLIAGMRYTHSSVTEDKVDPANTGLNINRLTVTATQPTFRLGLQQDIASHTMAYVTLSTGYKAPEISDDLSAGPMYEVRPELPTAVELGIKQSAFDDRLAIDADVFYDRVKDFQGNVTNFTQGSLFSFSTNVPRVTSKGVELDVFGQPLQGLALNLSGIWNPATYPTGYLGTDGTELGGKQLNFSSETKVTFSAEQTIPITGRYSFVVGADAAYRSAQSMFLSADPQLAVPAGTIVNARFGLHSSANWSVFMFGRNLGQTAFPRLLFPAFFLQANTYEQSFDNNSGRVVGFQLEAQF